MRSVNEITIIGNVGQDPKIIPTKNGKEMATFSVATTRQWKDNDGNLQKDTQWHRCIAFDGLSGIVKSYVTKGKPLYIKGEMRYGEYQNEEGNMVKTADIRVNDLVLLGGPKDGVSSSESEEVPF